MGKVKAYMVFTKFRLSALVVVSAITGYLFVGGSDGFEITLLLVGGLLVTAASNGSNQIWERDLDKLMKRTERRPIPMGKMSVTEGVIVVSVCLIAGTYMLFLLNLYSALLGLAAFISYVFIYTPMKRVSPWAVFIGAFPGAIPPMLGAVASSTNNFGTPEVFGLVPGVLFFVQFVWQFPHFWAIAWVSFDDYKAGGFSLLPSREGKSKSSAFQIVAYALALIPFSLLPWVMGWTGIVSLILVLFLGIGFFLYSYRLLLTCDDKDARKLMFASFLYLPLVQFLYVLDRVEGAIPINY
ncbi:MAG: heme o synthase [Crocinitomicaceae bacterium]|jgi:protoheme IX farnesyltransferase|nr:heme o synthase [Crocinitomicaceae bacterium]MDC1195905.1 heme o synthase [Crocinitomicaceae bacterium]|tara:strand:- start:1847 stop:2737 length:891 start_codon:yes stop_codon:yes gene_type:complete